MRSSEQVRRSKETRYEAEFETLVDASIYTWKPTNMNIPMSRCHLVGGERDMEWEESKDCK